MSAASLHTGLVLISHGRHLVVEDQQGRRIHCHLRSKKNTCVVGDRVLWAASGDGGVVEQLLTRRNVFYRQDAQRSKSFAANVDQLVLMLAAEPLFTDDWLTRCLVAAASSDLPVLIVLNKADLTLAHETAWQRLAPYHDLGYRVLSLSLQQTSGLDALKDALHGRTSLILGPSGTGKSSLINTLIPQAQSRTASLSATSLSGRHTTTHSTWYWLDEAGSALIDTPGFQGFGLHHIAAQDLARCFVEMRPHLGQCRFANCSHSHEPGCSVQAAVGQSITPARYQKYLALYTQLSDTGKA